MQRILSIALCTGLIGACGTPLKSPSPDDPSILPRVEIPQSRYLDGAIYSDAAALVLFEDVHARRVGDVLTVVLSERTDASKSARTSTDRETSFALAPGPLLGADVSSNTLDSEQGFEGSGSSVQNNRLSGSVTVTVVEVLPNGLLTIQGAKWITINQGREYLQILGQVRAADVAADNTVSSTQIANARIAYSGSGALADANREGWLTRLFGSILSPL